MSNGLKARLACLGALEHMGRTTDLHACFDMRGPGVTCDMCADPGLQMTCVRAGVKHAVVFQGPFWGQKGPLKYIQHLANICREAFQMSLTHTSVVASYDMSTGLRARLECYITDPGTVGEDL